MVKYVFVLVVLLLTLNNVSALEVKDLLPQLTWDDLTPEYFLQVLKNFHQFFKDVDKFAKDNAIALTGVIAGLSVQIFWSLIWMRTIVGGGSSSAAWGFYFKVSAVILGLTALYVFGMIFYTKYTLGEFDHIYKTFDDAFSSIIFW